MQYVTASSDGIFQTYLGFLLRPHLLRQLQRMTERDRGTGSGPICPVVSVLECQPRLCWIWVTGGGPLAILLSSPFLFFLPHEN